MMDAAAAAHFEERERETEREEYKESPLSSSILLRRSRDVMSLDIMEKKRGLMSFCRHNQRAFFEEYIFTQKWTKIWPG